MEVNVLHLPLKSEWYNKIDSGEKKEEYREIKRYWKSRICKNYIESPNGSILMDLKDINVVEFSYGYTKRKIKFEIDNISVGKGRVEWGAPKDRNVFIIKLGRRLI